MLRKEQAKRGKTMAKPGSKASVVSAKLRGFWQSYEGHCAESGSCVSPSVKKDVLRCIEDGKSMTKITLAFPQNTSGVEVSCSLRALLLALRDTRYTEGRELVIWGLSPKHQDVADLCLLLERRGQTEYPFRQLELLDCRLDAWSLGRLSRAVTLSSLTSLCLDYTPIEEEGVRRLLCGLEGDKHVVSLSLCYCNLDPGSGPLLAALVSNSAVRDLYINGNSLQCEGATELVGVLAEYAESQAQEAQEEASHLAGTAKSNTQKTKTVSSEGGRKKGKGRKRTKKKTIMTPADIGPWLEKLHLSDNAIDRLGPERTLGTLNFMQTICSLIKFSAHLAELDLSENHIGELSGKMLLEALQERREAELIPLKVKVSTQMSADTFANIMKNSKKLKSLKKRKKAKK